MVGSSLRLTRPVFEAMRAVATLHGEDSLRRAAGLLSDGHPGLVPVLDGGRICGVVTEASLARAMAEGFDADAPVRVAAQTFRSVPPYASGAEVLRTLVESGEPALVVLDDAGSLLGVVSASDLLGWGWRPPTPPVVGGMATPVGVYLTAGSVRAGAPGWALALTGAVLFLLYVSATLVATWLHGLFGAVGWMQQAVAALGPTVLFLLGLRLLPIAGIHGAEHKVVHAIERGEELVPSVVARMPRVHPRCGTNVAVGATLFLGIATSRAIPDESLRLIVAAVVTMLFWRRIGEVLQRCVTTREPNRKQLEGAIQAGRQLLENYRWSRIAAPGLWLRLRNSGLFHVMAGSLAAYGLLVAFAWLAGWPILL
ncbi:MAG: DUF1385 domain-containing protein [Fimbriimonadales bacterium]|nr:DUF1385 domain-containing protein [Fimbriimonadales bacterium]